MKKNTKKAVLHNILTFCLLLAIVGTYSMTASAMPENKSLMAELIVSGKTAINGGASATVDGEPAYSGRTFFSSGTIATAKDTSATVKLGKLGFINLSPDSNLSLNFSENKISGTLSAGQIKVFNTEGVEVNIQTPDGLISNRAQQTAVFSVDVQAGTTNVSAESGAVYMNNGTTVVPVKAQTDDSTRDSVSALAPLIVFGGAVAAAIIYIAVKQGNNNGAFISPTR